MAEQTEDTKRWLAIRKEEALKIDPQTAEVTSSWERIADPYGINPDLPPEDSCVGRVYFARSPGSDIWVSFYDLPEGVCDELRRRLESGATPEDDIPFDT